MKLHFIYRLLLIVFIALGCFYPALFAEPLSVDDVEVLQKVLNMGWDGVGALFVPGYNIYYFRPLVIFSFFLDGKFFGFETSFLHLENIIFHLSTGLALLALLRRWYFNKKHEQTWLPEIATLFFLLHPLVTEPVNWVSGRTDILAGFFVVVAMLWISPLAPRGPSLTRHIGAAVFLFLGLLCKETAGMLVPAVALGLFWQGTPLFVAEWRRRLAYIAPYLVVSGLYFLLRTGGIFHMDNGLVSATQGAHAAASVSYVTKLAGMIKAFGFYSGKLFWPFPLNFAIVEINRPLCWGLAFLALSALMVFLLRRRGKTGYWFCWGALFIVPSLLVAVQAMAWTPLAERYLYIPLMGVSMALAGICRRRSAIWLSVWALLLLPLGVASIQRTLLWQNNLSLFADVVAKSPGFQSGWNEYASALYVAGRKEDARAAYQRVLVLGEGGAKKLAQENLVKLFPGDGEMNAADESLGQLEAAGVDRKQSIRILRTRLRIIDKQLMAERNPAQRRMLLENSLGLLQKLAMRDHSPFVHYRMGQMQLALHRREEAGQTFGHVCRSSNDYYTDAACKLEKTLRSQNGLKMENGIKNEAYPQ